jgi:hypothetical protein
MTEGGNLLTIEEQLAKLRLVADVARLPASGGYFFRPFQ